MSKINSEFGIDSNAVSLDALKSVEKDDMVIFVRAESVQLLTVTDKVTKRGRNGGTSLTLADFHGGATVELAKTDALPEGVSMIRKVLRGVNVRTLRKARSAADAEPTVAPEAPAAPEAAPEVVMETAAPEVEAEVAQCVFADEMSESDRLIADILAGKI